MNLYRQIFWKDQSEIGAAHVSQEVICPTGNQVEMLQCVAVCCSVLQCVAVCYSVFQCVAVCCGVLRLLQCIQVCIAVCSRVLPCVAVCVAVCVAACVAVCCSVRCGVCCSVCWSVRWCAHVNQVEIRWVTKEIARIFLWLLTRCDTLMTEQCSLFLESILLRILKCSDQNQKK